MSKYILKLYVTGETPSSTRAIRDMRGILKKELKGCHVLRVIDVLKHPHLAEQDKILATPTLIKKLPPPLRKLVGDLSDMERVLMGIDYCKTSEART